MSLVENPLVSCYSYITSKLRTVILCMARIKAGFSADDGAMETAGKWCDVTGRGKAGLSILVHILPPTGCTVLSRLCGCHA